MDMLLPRTGGDEKKEKENTMNNAIPRTAAFVSALSLATLTFGTLPAQAADNQAKASKPSIVLVHGGFADGTGWQDVIPLLQKEGYKVVAVQNSLASLPEDIANTKRVIAAQGDAVVAVGHSYGGAVISGAAVGEPKVKALVYVAAFAPEKGEKINELHGKFGKAPLGDALVPDAQGFFTIAPQQFRAVFAHDVSESQAAVMAATQKPFSGAAFTGSLETNPAWKTTPSWYLVAKEDKAILPELQRFMAKRINAKTAEVKASHVPFISKAKETAQLILEAAKSVQ